MVTSLPDFARAPVMDAADTAHIAESVLLAVQFCPACSDALVDDSGSAPQLLSCGHTLCFSCGGAACLVLPPQCPVCKRMVSPDALDNTDILALLRCQNPHDSPASSSLPGDYAGVAVGTPAHASDSTIPVSHTSLSQDSASRTALHQGATVYGKLASLMEDARSAYTLCMKRAVAKLNKSTSALCSDSSAAMVELQRLCTAADRVASARLKRLDAFIDAVTVSSMQLHAMVAVYDSASSAPACSGTVAALCDKRVVRDIKAAAHSLINEMSFERDVLTDMHRMITTLADVHGLEYALSCAAGYVGVVAAGADVSTAMAAFHSNSQHPIKPSHIAALIGLLSRFDYSVLMVDAVCRLLTTHSHISWSHTVAAVPVLFGIIRKHLDISEARMDVAVAPALRVLCHLLATPERAAAMRGVPLADHLPLLLALLKSFTAASEAHVVTSLILAQLCHRHDGGASASAVQALAQYWPMKLTALLKALVDATASASMITHCVDAMHYYATANSSTRHLMDAHKAWYAASVVTALTTHDSDTAALASLMRFSVLTHVTDTFEFKAQYGIEALCRLAHEHRHSAAAVDNLLSLLLTLITTRTAAFAVLRSDSIVATVRHCVDNDISVHPACMVLVTALDHFPVTANPTHCATVDKLLMQRGFLHIVQSALWLLGNDSLPIIRCAAQALAHLLPVPQFKAAILGTDIPSLVASRHAADYPVGAKSALSEVAKLFASSLSVSQAPRFTRHPRRLPHSSVMAMMMAIEDEDSADDF